MGSKACTEFRVNAQCRSASHRVPILRRESGKLGITYAWLAYAGRVGIFKVAKPFDEAILLLATRAFISLILQSIELVRVVVVMKFEVVSESAIADALQYNKGEL